ncbi:ABC transporter ATP-binding protein [Marinomonas mediterranea]|uniref:ABC transporter ATP-binding protein n=1 Tax=Marinomonas mediterranea TaxID=119864 RepID=UPI0023490EBA|nr:ABC transporter ATP-binding protein [Marinomonas mediterranea]WCN10844.1 ATP-binding cassette domain-containing protein [Marinomonas mediterranea]WCN14901.1 ATP-binding cassette domain-containing protein [Marinomonas mediterranea]
MSMLSIENLVANHGLLNAVKGVSFAVEKGDVLSIFGSNGAGKTTLFRAISGVHPIVSGSVLLDGDAIDHVSANRRVEKGLVMVPEGRRLFSDMTVKENLMVAAEHGRKGDWELDKVVDALPGLTSIVNKRAGGLSGGQRQSVAIGRALMSNPTVLLIDEVSLGLSPIAIGELYESLDHLKQKRDVTFIIVEQDLNRAITFSDHTICMLEGSIELEGKSSTLDKKDIYAAYFGVEEAADA